MQTFKEYLNEGMNDKAEIDIDFVIDSDDHIDMLHGIFKEYKIKWHEKKKASSKTAIRIEGKKKDLIKYLTSKHYDLDKSEVKEFWPELFK